MVASLDPKRIETYPLKTFTTSGPASIEMTYCDVSPEGPPKDTILFVHGFPEFFYEWRYQIKHFVGLGYRCIAPNTRGYNKGEPHPRQADVETRNANYSYGRAARDLKDLLDHEGLSKVIVCGHDWGALLCQRFCLLFPEYFKLFILVCIPYIPPPDQYVPLEVAAKAMPMLNYQVYFNTDKAEDRLTANPEEFINVMFRPGAPNTGEGLSKITPEDGVMALAGPDLPPTTLLTPDEIKTYANFYRSIGGLNGPLQWYRMGEASFPEFVNVPKEINVKTLFVGAEYDPFSSPAFTAPMTHFIKDLKMKEVKGAGHWVAYEKYAELNAAIEDWLERGI